METLDTIAETYKKLRKLQDQQVEAAWLPPARCRRRRSAATRKLKDELITEVKSLSLNQNRIEALVEQLYDINKRLVSWKAACCGWPKATVKRDDFLTQYQGAELDAELAAASCRGCRPSGWKEFAKENTIARSAPRSSSLATETGISISEFRRIVHDGAEGRARGAHRQEGNGRGQPAPRDLHRQEIHQPRPAVPRPDPGRQHRPDEGGRQVRVPPRLQVLHLRHVVDPAGDHPLDRRPGAHHPHPGAHDRDDQQDRPHVAPDAARDRPRADAGGTGREARHAAREGAQGDEDRQGADLASKRRSATRKIRISAISSRTRTPSCRSTRRSRRTCARPPPACWPR
jgi:hypothetical protein